MWLNTDNNKNMAGTLYSRLGFTLPMKIQEKAVSHMTVPHLNIRESFPGPPGCQWLLPIPHWFKKTPFCYFPPFFRVPRTLTNFPEAIAISHPNLLSHIYQIFTTT